MQCMLYIMVVMYVMLIIEARIKSCCCGKVEVTNSGCGSVVTACNSCCGCNYPQYRLLMVALS